ncbi:hypothetical protein ACP70R_035201 [Stipagrostis hirtigluma subsp. patula]
MGVAGGGGAAARTGRRSGSHAAAVEEDASTTYAVFRNEITAATCRHPRHELLLARYLRLRPDRGRAGFPVGFAAGAGGDALELPRDGGAAGAGVGARVVQGRDAVQEPHAAATQG